MVCAVVEISASHGDDVKMAVFWVVAQCSLVEIAILFRDAYCLQHQGDYDGGSKHL
jgi:hypothetical protein